MRVAVLLLASCWLVLGCGRDGGSAAAAGEPVAETASEARAIGLLGAPELGRGFAVWESNRGGAWRLWRRDLEGGGEPAALTPV
ncbi:MAG: hypothetical protein AAGF23_08575, partial [Acidobacteriota bacterium]